MVHSLALKEDKTTNQNKNRTEQNITPFFVLISNKNFSCASSTLEMQNILIQVKKHGGFCPNVGQWEDRNFKYYTFFPPQCHTKPTTTTGTLDFLHYPSKKENYIELINYPSFSSFFPFPITMKKDSLYFPSYCPSKNFYRHTFRFPFYNVTQYTWTWVKERESYFNYMRNWYLHIW